MTTTFSFEITFDKPDPWALRKDGSYTAWPPNRVAKCQKNKWRCKYGTATTTSVAACVPTYSRSRASDGDHAPARTCAVPGWKDEAAPPSISLHAGAGWQPQVYSCLIRLPRAVGPAFRPS